MMSCQKRMMMMKLLLLMMNKRMSWMQLRMMCSGYIICGLFMVATIQKWMLGWWRWWCWCWLLHMGHLKTTQTKIGRILLNMLIHWFVCFYKIGHNLSYTGHKSDFVRSQARNTGANVCFVLFSVCCISIYINLSLFFFKWIARFGKEQNH